jgi:hypothetical protein
MPQTWSPKPLILHKQYLEITTDGEGVALQAKQAAVWGGLFLFSLNENLFVVLIVIINW